MPLENGRWQGKIEGKVDENSRRIDAHDRRLDAIDKSADDYREQTAAEIAALKAKVGFGAFFGSIIGSIAVGIVVIVITRGLS